MCHDIVTHMKTATIRELKHGTSRVLSLVAGGESVEVRRRNEPVAILSPPTRPSMMPPAAITGMFTTATDLVAESRGDS